VTWILAKDHLDREACRHHDALTQTVKHSELIYQQKYGPKKHCADRNLMPMLAYEQVRVLIDRDGCAADCNHREDGRVDVQPPAFRRHDVKLFCRGQACRF